MAKVVTADNLREVAGAGSVVKISPHTGVLRRPSETRKSRSLDEWPMSQEEWEKAVAAGKIKPGQPRDSKE